MFTFLPTLRGGDVGKVRVNTAGMRVYAAGSKTTFQEKREVLPEALIGHTRNR